MKFFYLTLMPYAALDLAERAKHKTAWVTLPNRLYDPEKGKALYETYLADLVRADQLGFDGVVVNEHHQTAYGMMPSPIVIASILARETKRCKIAILGSAIPLRDHPLTLAEEHAMIDTISGGRLISGFVRGIGAEYHVFGRNPAQSHDRFHEAHDLIVRAWSEPGPFSFEGKYYHFQYVNLWPRPFQQPHPPVWIPSQGSTETVDWASHPTRKYTLLQTFSPATQVARFLGMYKERAAQYGYEASPDQLGWAVPVYVGETDESAVREAKPHFENFRSFFVKMPMEMLLPPGYLSLNSMARVMGAKTNLESDLTIEQAMELGMIVCGSAATVRDKLRDYRATMGFGNLLTMLQFGTMPGEMTAQNQRRFAEGVIKPLRAEAAAMAAQ
jgi:alkanesulfonate monooxygenase SsuD/methylene tetrahydromethanopterin reductase-like flavin-dependent oxidoreductase (luciferase family)